YRSGRGEPLSHRSSRRRVGCAVRHKAVVDHMNANIRRALLKQVRQVDGHIVAIKNANVNVDLVLGLSEAALQQREEILTIDEQPQRTLLKAAARVMVEPFFPGG